MRDTRTALSAPPTAFLPTPDEAPGHWSMVVPLGVTIIGDVGIVGIAEVWSVRMSEN